MALAHQVGDISVLSAAGIDLLALFDDVTYTVTETTVDGSILARTAKRAEGQKLEAKLETKVMSTKGSGDRVGHLDLSAVALGSDSYLGLIRNFTLNGSFEQQMRAGAGSLWKRRQNTVKDYAVDFELDCEADVASTLMLLLHSATATDRDMDFGFTLNSVAITIPMRLTEGSISGQRNGLQVFKGKMMGKDPGTGTYPTAPTGTTSLLQKAFNSWTSDLTCVFTSKSADGFSCTGSYIFESFSIQVQDENLEYEQYAFANNGAITPSAT